MLYKERREQRENKASDVKERVPNAEGSHHQRKCNYTSPKKDKIVFKGVGKTAKNFTPLITRCEQI